MTHYEAILSSYDSIHRAPLNRLTHAIGIPLIITSITAAASYLHLPGGGVMHYASLATLLSLGTIAIVLSWSRAAGVAYAMLIVACYIAAQVVTAVLTGPAALAAIAAGFVVGWGFQFLGHAFEGKSPQFVKRPENLLLGPVVIMAELFPGNTAAVGGGSVRAHGASAMIGAGTLTFLGRALLSLLFILAGVAKIVTPAPFIAHMREFGVPVALLPAVIGLEIGGGLALFAGWRLRYSAGTLAAFCVLTALIFHHDLGDKAERSLFFKDLAIAGGLLALAA